MDVDSGAASSSKHSAAQEEKPNGSEGPSKRARVDNLRVVIAGGGLGGLATCIALQKAGISATVYERDARFLDKRQGYGLTLNSSKQGALGVLGVLDECIAQDCPSRWHWVFGPHGEVLGYYGRAFSPRDATEPGPAGRGIRGNLRIPRQDLRQMLLDRVDPGSVVWGHRIVDYVEHDGGVDCKFDNGCVVEADILVGAEGIRSTVRRLRDERSAPKKAPPSGLRYTGIAVIVGLSPTEHPLLNAGGFYVLDGVHRLFTMPFRQRSEGDGLEATQLTMWQLSFSGLSEDVAAELGRMNAKELIAEAERRTVNWFEPATTLISETPVLDGFVWATGLYDRDPLVQLPRQSGSLVTVVGDAAHPMTMFKGQGANQALCDGPLLARWLTKPGKRTPHALRTRLRCFEREMTARSTPQVLGSRNAASHLHDPAVLTDQFGVEGVEMLNTNELLEQLRDAGITASLSGDLEAAVSAKIHALSTLGPETK